jgi:ribosomal protein S8
LAKATDILSIKKKEVGVNTDLSGLGLSGTKDIGVQSGVIVENIGVNTVIRSTEDIGVQSSILSTKNVGVNTVRHTPDNVEFNISPIKAISPIKPISGISPIVNLDEIIQDAKNKKESSIGELIKDNLQNLAGSPLKSGHSVISTSQGSVVSESIVNTPTSEDINMFLGPIKDDIVAWVINTNADRSIESDVSVEASTSVISDKSSLMTKISHLELKSASLTYSSISDMNVRNAILDNLKSQGFIKSVSHSDVESSEVLSSAFGSSQNVGKNGMSSSSEEPLNLLLNPMRDQIDVWLKKHHLSLNIPRNEKSEYDKAINSIISAISGKDYRRTTYEDIAYKEDNFIKLTEKGYIRDLDGKMTYDFSKLKSAISEPKVLLQSKLLAPGPVSTIKATSANPDLHLPQPAAVPESN